LTPNSDGSDSDSDVELGGSGKGASESYKLQSRTRRGESGEKGGDDGTDDEDEDEDEDEERYSRGGRRASVSTVQSYQLYTPDEERAVLRKFDRRLVLFVALLYMLSFLDRSSWFPLPSPSVPPLGTHYTQLTLFLI